MRVENLIIPIAGLKLGGGVGSYTNSLYVENLIIPIAGLKLAIVEAIPGIKQLC